ncbi:hypothetical protein C8Q79DRAFT_930661 [Trametes meyenii]|nr:hypothetical protein C8Q79DRAFT_930661 [Trametes meyenii]
MRSAELDSLEELYTAIPTLQQVYYQYLATQFPTPEGAHFSHLTLSFKSGSGHLTMKTDNDAREYARRNPDIHKYLDVHFDAELAHHFPWGADREGRPWPLHVPAYT